MTHEGGPGSGPKKDGLSSAGSLKVGAHLTYNQDDPKNKSGIKYEKPSTYPKPPGRLQMSQHEASNLLPYSSGPPHISTYPLSKHGSLAAGKTKPNVNEADSPSTPLKGCLMPKMNHESDGGSSFPQALRGQKNES